MKYTARHIQRFLDAGKIDAEIWKKHFPSLLPSTVPACEECSALSDGSCPGGKDPVECILAKTAALPTEDRRQKKRDPMLGLGSKRLTAHGTAIPKDQSKM